MASPLVAFRQRLNRFTREAQIVASLSHPNQFDPRAFHDRVLENGSLPLPMLEKSLAAWLE